MFWFGLVLGLYGGMIVAAYSVAAIVARCQWLPVYGWRWLIAPFVVVKTYLATR